MAASRLTDQSTSTSITPPHAPQRMLRGARLLKRWRYVGIFCEHLMACAAQVRIGPARQCFWAVYPRAGLAGDADGLRERTHLLRARGAVALAPGRVSVHDAGV